nr:integrase, catalytic region, zinc finger, CCHC-type, peptidase aspartic, catalytic [Tanacetum cinerariifolium]
MIDSPLIDSGFVVLVFSQRDDPIACRNKGMAFLTAVASLRGDKVKVILVLVIRVMLLVLRETMQVDRQGLLNATTVKVKDIWLGNALSLSDQGMQHGGTFTIVGNSCPLTRITSANVVPSKTTTSHSVESQKPELKVYSKKLKNVKNIGLSKKAKIVESKNANHSEPNHTWGSNTTDIPSSSSLVMKVRFGNDHIVRIMRYADYELGNVTISKVYYVKGLGHNLFSVGQFCDANLEVAFRKTLALFII